MSRMALILCCVLAACGHESGPSDGGGGGGDLAPTDDVCPTSTATEPRTVATTRGLVRGVQQGGAVAFLGLPYAAPPVGERRFQPPAQHACWTDVRDASQYGPQCAQRDVVSGAMVGDEDCLFLNVWTPALDETAKLPVLFWIHGGANVLGSADQRLNAASGNLYDGSALATRERAVVVSINYRLGAFGFLAHAALEAESPQGAAGNYAIHDQLLALRWVRDNVARFGGDPDRVTVFGESAGAMNTCILFTSPLGEGLFSRALMESGDCSARPRDKAKAAGAAFAAKLGCADLDCLRQASAAAIVEATPPFPPKDSTSSDLRHGMANSLDFSASIDGWAVTEDPMARLAAGRQNKVPLVVGSNAQEMALFLVTSQTFSCGQYEADMNAIFGADAAKVIAAYPCSVDGHAAEVDALTDLAFTCSARRIVQAQAQAGLPAFRYRFEHTADYGYTVPLRAYHAAELAYVFGNFSAVSYAPTPREQTLSETMQEHWGRFAATGAPNGAGLMTWPAWTAADQRWLRFEVDGVAAAPDDRAERCALWAQLMGW